MKKVLLVCKESAYQAHNELVKSGKLDLTRIQQSHETHYDTLNFIKRLLTARKVHTREILRGHEFDETDYDLVISVGGDGTFLDAAKKIKNKLLLGINSDIDRSVGRFCCANKVNFEKIIDLIIRGKFKPTIINRMEISFNDKKIETQILNDILVHHSSPAGMSQYVLEIKGHQERQRGSGIWISTAAGSTGAIKSSGGKALPLKSKALQYIPRELYQNRDAHYRFRGGLFRGDGTFTICSQMYDGMIYMDGAHKRMPFKFGDKVVVHNSRYPLRAVYLMSNYKGR